MAYSHKVVLGLKSIISLCFDRRKHCWFTVDGSILLRRHSLTGEEFYQIADVRGDKYWRVSSGIADLPRRLSSMVDLSTVTRLPSAVVSRKKSPFSA